MTIEVGKWYYIVGQTIPVYFGRGKILSVSESICVISSSFWIHNAIRLSWVHGPAPKPWWRF